MTAIYTAILLFSATGSAQWSIVVEPSIERIILQVAAGGAKHVLSRQALGTTGLGSGIRGSGWPALEIDSRPASGPIAYLRALDRLAGYILQERPPEPGADAVERGRRGNTGSAQGSVGWTYRLRLRGLDVRRSTTVSDGRLTLTTEARGRMGPGGDLHYVRLVLLATETSGGTCIVGTATGWTPIGERCRLVRRVASREVSRGLRDAIGVIETEGRKLYSGGSPESLIDEFIERLAR